jgi:predicted alpha/beta hydrolase
MNATSLNAQPWSALVRPATTDTTATASPRDHVPVRISEPETFSALDGTSLRGVWHRPEQPRYVTVFSSATAVPQSYYHPFASFLAARAHAVLTWDYRGIGLSRRRRWAPEAATMDDWTDRDLPGAIRYARAAHPDLPLLLVGHSLGGQGMLLTPRLHDAEASLLVASGSGFWGHALPHLKQKRRVQFSVLLPGFGRALGYVPGWMGIGEDLPGGVAVQWSQRCRTPTYFEAEREAMARDNLGRLGRDVLSVAFSDDDYIPPVAVAALSRLVPENRLALRTVTPTELGVPAIGHFKVFREKVGGALWPQLAAWLETRAAT